MHKFPTPAAAISKEVIDWVRAMLRGPTSRVVYTITNLPDATIWDGTTLPVSNGAGGKPTVTAVNGAWVYGEGTPV